MAVGTAPQSQYDAFIHDKLEQAQSRVRFMEIGTGVLLTLGFVLTYLLILAVIDHWIYPLGTLARVAALLGLICGTAYLAYVRLWPPIANPIDPAFAAGAIERNQPSLKNSLLNYWFLRSDEARVHRAVLQAIEKRAATDLTGVAVDVVVDNKSLIRLATIVGIIFLCVPVYAYFSPKNPFQTMARVALPFAGIDQPTRVNISDVSPKNTNIPFGTSAKISAKVTGLSDDEKPLLVVTRQDGSEYKLAMAPGEGSSVWAVALTDEWLVKNSDTEITAYDPKAIAPNSELGLRKPVTYQIQAGDAATETYNIGLGLSPTVAVLNVRYEYPPYTGLLPTSTKEEMLTAPESTKVKISIEANYPLTSAELELDRSGASADQPAKKIRMSVKDQTAHGEFWLNLAPNRRDPEFTHYRVRVTTTDGFQNKNPVRQRIRVTPDLKPEITRQVPQAEEATVAADGKLKMVFRASDPDYSLTDVRVRVAKNGREILVWQNPVLHKIENGQPLLQPGKTESGQFIGHWQLDPQSLKLQAGDQVLVWATAEDNRQVPAWNAEPNEGRSTNLSVKITAAKKAADDTSSQDQSPRQDNPAKDNQNNQNSNPKDDDNQNSGKQETGNQDNEGDSADDSGQEMSESGSGSDDTGDMSSDEPKEGEGGSRSMGESGSNDGANEESSEGNDTSQDKSDAGGEGAGSAGQSDSGEADSGMEPMELSEGEGNSSGGESGGEASDQTSENSGSDSPTSEGGSGTNPSNGNNSQNGTGNQPGGDPSAGTSQSGNPTENTGSEEPLHDGEIIEKINEYRRRKEMETTSKSPNTGPQESSESGTEETGDEETGDASANDESTGEEGQPGSKDDMDDPSGMGDSNTEGMSGDESGSTGEAGSETGMNNPMGEGSGGSNPRHGEKPVGADNGEPGAGSQNNPQNGSENVAGEKPEEGSGNSGQQPDPMANQPKTDGAKPDGEGSKDSGMGEPTETKENGSNPMEGGMDSGSGMGSSGESGAGNTADNESGSGEAQGKNEDRPKDAQGGEKGEGSDPSSPSNSDKQSDSQGGEGGDRSGGGDQGAGQSSGQEGNDSAGTSSPGDTGSGAAEESGTGETADRPGDKQPGGQEGNDPGPGKGTRPADQAGSEPRGTEAGTSESGSKNSSKQPGGNQQTGGGGIPSSEGRSGNASSGDLPPAEKAKIEYAKEATNLALETLKNEADPELLEELKMTPEELAAWKERIGSWKNDATSDEGARKYEENLRSLGLRPKSGTQGGNVNDDRHKGIRQTGVQSKPPPGYAEGMRSFQKRGK
jgi:hypothetical protein